MSTECNKNTEKKETIKTAIKQFINATVDLGVELYFEDKDNRIKKENTNGKTKPTRTTRKKTTAKKSRK